MQNIQNKKISTFDTDFSINDLFQAGVHLGHNKSRWNPKMSAYLYGIRNASYVIDLKKTNILLKNALKFLHHVVKEDGKVLFVSTKESVRNITEEFATKCGQFYINHRWLGGMLTNWKSISKSIRKLDYLDKLLTDQKTKSIYTKKEILLFEKKKEKLNLLFKGIRNMKRMPNAVIIINTNKDNICVKESFNLGIPTVAVLDTNSNPDMISYPIPGNDDSIKSISFYLKIFHNAILNGIEEYVNNKDKTGDKAKVSK